MSAALSIDDVEWSHTDRVSTFVREVSHCSRMIGRMPRGNPSPKLAITVDPKIHARVVDAAAQDGLSVSAWMTEAARRALVIRDGLAAVAEWERIHGEFSGAEMAAARRRVADELGRPRRRSA